MGYNLVVSFMAHIVIEMHGIDGMETVYGLGMMSFGFFAIISPPFAGQSLHPLVMKY